jgi:putative hydrolase of the HAD superfamily
MKTIKNVVFDVGDVLVHFRYRDHMKEMGFSEDAVDCLSENMVLTEFWHLMDRGDKMEKDAIEHFTSLYPEYRQEILTFWAHTEGLVSEYPYAQPLLHHLKELGYGVYVLSNFGERAQKRAVEMGAINFLDLLDGYIFSYMIHEIKPDRAIFDALAEKYGLNLGECVFIDDREDNVEAAKSYGMQGIVFTGYEDACEKLRTLGVSF